MRFAILYLRTLSLAALILTFSACQSAQKPVAQVPPRTAPALEPAPAPAPAPPTASELPQAPAEKKQDGALAAKVASTQVPVPEIQPKSDPVGDLVAKAESEYQAGLANYHAGKAEDAKHNFDNALNALLSRPRGPRRQ